jgi:TetR/AcrR family transcriptional regulator, transcriptional repressor for nem operon
MEKRVVAAEAAGAGGDEAFLKYLQDSLIQEYPENSAASEVCPLVAMGSELARSDPETRRAASQGFQRLIKIGAKHSRQRDASSALEEAIFTLTSMIGAATMSRIVDDPGLSTQIIDVVRKRLAAPAIKKAAPKVKRH